MDALVLSAAARQALAKVWAYRAGSERQAVARFTRLHGELGAVGAAPEVLALAEAAIEDERRHVVICERLAHGYGDTSTSTSTSTSEAPPIDPSALGPRDRLLYEIVAFCCVTESLNAALMAVCRSAAQVDDVRAALREILADEVGHARLGWAHLAAERAAGRGDFLAAMLPRMLAATVADELFTPLPGGVDEAALRRHGELPEPARLAIFTSTMTDVVLPGLAGLGVDPRPAQAWLRAQLEPQGR